MIKDVIRGLQILSKYLPENEFLGGADHDIIYVCDPVEVSEEDAKELNELGFFLSDYHDCWAMHV